ncbi:MAG: NfeD family protein [Deltaproteobacteria bacterium]|nr:MAG: NfeD family protein [Deltaproteobacteria bacterium]
MQPRASSSEAEPSARSGPGERLGVVGKYWLFQSPGIVMAAVVLYGLHAYEILTPRWALVLFGLWIAKEVALFPLVRIAYEPHRRGGAHDLVGASGVAVEDLDPTGYVRLGPELWRAEIRGSGQPIPAGARVRVCAVLGLTLLCEPDDEQEADLGAASLGRARAVTEET